MKRKIKLIIQYDGTDFSGWQIQNNERSVQGEIEKALEEIHESRIRVTGSGRTDSGVHARGQAAHFETEKDNIPAEKFVPAINSQLPGDILITAAFETHPDFHARYDAVCRHYKYYFMIDAGKDVFNRKFSMTINRIPDIKLLNSYASGICGTHDFTTFTASGDKSKSKERNIYSASFYYENEYMIFSIKGNAFLWKMVRSLSGTMIELEKEKKPAEYFKNILYRKSRKLAGKTAPAAGLFLEKVYYGGIND